MSVKQDRTYARTAQDLERKYSFGKTFGEMLGLISEYREKVDSVSSTVNSQTELFRDMEKLIFKVIEEGVDKVVTETGYRLDADGLHISKTGQGIDNHIDHTGMYVKSAGENILTANYKGVDAVNRTGCYWIGG